MRTISFIIALSFALIGASFTGSANASLPGAGAFSYTGSNVIPADQSIKVAGLILTRRS